MDDFDVVLARVPEAKRSALQAWWNGLSEAHKARGLSDINRQYPRTPAVDATTSAMAPESPANLPPRMQQFLGGFQALPETPSTMGAFGIGAQQGFALGGRDEIAGLVSSDPNATELARYQQHLAQEDSPIAYGVGQAVGGTLGVLGLEGLASKAATMLGLETIGRALAPTAARGFVGNVVRSGVEGSLLGGATGALSSPEGQRGPGALQGAVFGAPAGLLGAVGGEALGGLMGLRYSPEVRMMRTFADADNANLARVGQELTDHPNLFPLDVMGQRTLGTARALAQGSGPARDILEQAIIPRQMERGGRVLMAAEREVGNPGNPFQYAERLRVARQQEGEKLFDGALKPKGQAVILPADRTAPLVRIPRIRQLIDEFRAIRNSSAPDAAARSGVQTQAPGLERVTAEELHYVKRRLAELGEGAEPGGAAATQATGHGANSLQGAVADVLNGVPGYSHAARRYAQQSRLMEAYDLGAKSFEGDARRIEHLTSRMGREELEQFRLGQVSAIEGSVVNNGPGRTLAKLGMGRSASPGRRDLMETFAPTPEGQARMTGTLLGEERMLPSESIFGNSASGERITSVAENIAGDLANAPSFTGAVARPFRKSLFGQPMENLDVLRMRTAVHPEGARLAGEAATLGGRQTALRDVGVRLGSGGSAFAGQQGQTDPIAEAEGYYAELIRAGVTPERALELASTRFGLK